MSEYGFRISTFEVTGRGNSQVLPFHGIEDIRGRCHSALEALRDGAPRPNDGRRQYNEVLDVQSSDCGRLVLCVVKGGSSSDACEVTDTAGSALAEIREGDALTWRSRVLYFFPSDQATVGIQVFETRGNSAHGTSTNDRLIDHLKRQDSLTLSFRTDVADGEAWGRLLQEEATQLEELRFETHGGAAGSFAEEFHVERVSVSLSLNPEDDGKRRILLPFRRDKDTPTSPGEIVDAVGGLPGNFDFEDGDVKAVVRVGQVRRTVRLRGGGGRFTRLLDSSTQLDHHAFIRAVTPDVLPLLDLLDVPGSGETLPLQGISPESP